MGRITIGFGVFLILVGVGTWLVSESRSPTALIPAAFGLILAILGFLALKDRLRMHVMHAAVLVGLIGLIGAGVMSGRKLPALLSGGEVERPLAVISQAITALTCAVFVGLCVRSFIEARRRRSAESKPE
jgi:uncharacterized membrane protein